VQKRNRDVTLRIEHHDPELTIEQLLLGEHAARGPEVHNR
jgi:hypothetical protein